VSRISVTLFTAAGCHLCERARETLVQLRRDLDFGLTEVDITGDPHLEARYREAIPVVEIEGRRAFTYFVEPASFRRKLTSEARAGDSRL
jgi:glutaredoxin